MLPDFLLGQGSVPFISSREARSTGSASPVRLFVESAYPETAPGARVRVVGMAAHMRDYGVSTWFRPNTTALEYQKIASQRVRVRSVAALCRGVVRASRVGASDDYDLTIVHRLRSLVPGLREYAPLDVYDFDDALYVGASSAHHLRLGALKSEARRCLSYIRRAQLVVAGNGFLAAKARELGARTEVVPSCVDVEAQRFRRHQEVETMTIGWIGSPTTAVYLKPLITVVSQLRARGCAIQLVVMGAGRAGLMQAEKGIELRPWSPDAEDALLAELDVGVMPLPDNEWTRGKCGYKLLRYFSAGVPAVASPVGINADLIAGGRGMAARSSDEWLRALWELSQDWAARRDMGERARQFVEQNYSYQVWAPRLAALLTELR